MRSPVSGRILYCRHASKLYCESRRKGLLRLWICDSVGEQMEKTRTWLDEVSRGQESSQTGHPTWDAQTVDMRVDCHTLGVLVLYTQGVVGEWVDLIISDLALDSLTEQRIHDLERELGSSVCALEIARAKYARGHAEIPGSNSFEIIRLCNVGAMGIECC